MNMQHSRQKIVDKVMSWLGCHEGDAIHKHIIDTYNAHNPAQGYKVKYTDKWCATTVSAAAIECGYTDIIPTECSCNRMIALAQKMGIWQESDAYVPQKADIVMYDWDDNGIGDNTGIPDHTGYVVSDPIANRFEVCEGNKSDGVNLRSMSVNGKYIRGYITPKYDDNPAVVTPAASIVRPPKKYKFGMDVSAYQGVIDFNKVKNEGIQFAILRATVKDQSLDQYFERNISECLKYKIPASVYKYSRALTVEQARAEAQGVIKALKGRKLLVWYDLEDNTQTPLGKTGIQIIANTFMTELFNAGIACGIYCNVNWYNNLMSDYLKNNVAFWIARYKKNDTGSFDESHKPTGIKNLYGWQYTSKGSLAGITGNVDLDINLM